MQKIIMYGNGLNNFMAELEENLVTVTTRTRINNSKLKESTGRLLGLLDEIDAKTQSKSFKAELEDNPSTVKLNDAFDDCTVYKKLSRICQCLNQPEYTDLIMEFNSDTRYHTNRFGGILKNIRCVKKFLYIGNEYSCHALKFMLEGLLTSTPVQKAEIIKACAYADICNVFDDPSIVKKCIVSEYNNMKRQIGIPNMASEFLDKLAATEEGKKYLTLSGKLTQEMIEFIKNEGINLDPNLRDYIYDILDILRPGPLIQNFYFKSVDASECSKSVKILVEYHEYMSLEEASNHLRTLKTLSDSIQTRTELVKRIPLLINVFKNLILKFNDSEFNIIVTNILNNIVTRNMIDNEAENIKRKYKSRSTSPLNFRDKKGKKRKVNFY